MREAGKYLIINPGKPGRRELKKTPRRKVTRRRNPENDHIIAVLNFAKEKLRNTEISERGRRQIHKCLQDINDVLIRETNS